MLKRYLVVIAATLSLGGCLGVQVNTQERSFFTALDDLNMQIELNARLIGESGALFANVNSTVIEGRIHVSGTVPSPDQRILVTRIAWSIPRVTEVVNDIEVTIATGLADTALDRWITAQVRSLILSDISVRDSNYTIDTESAVVYIHGIAQNHTEMERVLVHARSVSEAKRVVNYALLKDDPRRFSTAAQRVADTQR
ncbi:MAG: BON domain-containing protein [Alphaproteobacteria bacterium]|nr:BON domain-containing protein [Alphaproteobacteria bacterium]